VIKVFNQKEEKRLNDEIYRLTNENNQLVDDNVKNKKTVNGQEEQINALKKRIKKMKTNKGRL
jgi:predicted  nucleic acid-binding Zn-ribbon protein